MNATLEQPSGESVELDGLIQNQKSIVILVRHLGWPVCREHITQLRERYDELSQYGYQVVVIAPHKGSFVQEFLNQFGDYPFPFYGDPDKQSYREVGAKSMPKSKLLMKSLKGFVKGSISNVMPKDKGQKDVVMKSMKSEDVSIQGATLVFDEHGNTIHMHLDSSPEDHISVNQLFQILEQQKS